jgi:hypothetical protein
LEDRQSQLQQQEQQQKQMQLQPEQRSPQNSKENLTPTPTTFLSNEQDEVAALQGSQLQAIVQGQVLRH